MAASARTFTYDAANSWFPRRDVRTEGWFLAGSPLPVAVITALYVYFVKVVGPRWMSKRKAFDLRSCILVYNLAATLLSAYFVSRFVKLAYWDLGYTFLQDLDLRDSPANTALVHLSWWFFLFKICELADTVFFVLRKKDHQVSALHVVHHVVVTWNMWLDVTYDALSHSMFIKCMNTFVHVFMYSYYFMAALGPAYRSMLWWKKYLTMMQITQFIILLVHAVGTVFAEGNYVRIFVWLEVAQAVMFFVWFVAFYVRAYSSKKRV